MLMNSHRRAKLCQTREWCSTSTADIWMWENWDLS